MEKILIYEKCERCGRILTAEKSMLDKMGKVCKEHEEKKEKENQIYIKGF